MRFNEVDKTSNIILVSSEFNKSNFCGPGYIACITRGMIKLLYHLSIWDQTVSLIFKYYSNRSGIEWCLKSHLHLLIELYSFVSQSAVRLPLIGCDSPFSTAPRARPPAHPAQFLHSSSAPWVRRLSVPPSVLSFLSSSLLFLPPRPEQMEVLVAFRVV